MYYHFCLLCAFRPIVSSEAATSELHAFEICTQAVQAILSLAQSYDDLFTLQRVSALVPYFLSACGFFSLAVEDSGSTIDFVQPRQQEAVNPEEADVQDTSNMNFLPLYTTTPSRITVSTVVQARLLLSKMASTHPAAAVAEKQLSEGLKSRHRTS